VASVGLEHAVLPRMICACRVFHVPVKWRTDWFVVTWYGPENQPLLFPLNGVTQTACDLEVH
jgi:hypothetical protein